MGLVEKFFGKLVSEDDNMYPLEEMQSSGVEMPQLARAGEVVADWPTALAFAGRAVVQHETAVAGVLASAAEPHPGVPEE